LACQGNHQQSRIFKFQEMEINEPYLRKIKKARKPGEE
jgi:hypothetical protein